MGLSLVRKWEMSRRESFAWSIPEGPFRRVVAGMILSWLFRMCLGNALKTLKWGFAHRRIFLRCQPALMSGSSALECSTWEESLKDDCFRCAFLAQPMQK